MTYDRSEAVARAQAARVYAPGMCLQWTRKMYGIAALYTDASSAWRNATKRHPGDRTPPVGAPVFWTGGRSGHGHVAVYIGGGKIRSTDTPTKGLIGTVDLEWVERHWGLKYEGWTEDLNGVTIPAAPVQPLEVIAYNVKSGRGAEAGRDVSALVAEQAHVLHLFEMAGNRRAVWRAVRKHYRRPITGRGADGASTWTLVRKDVKVRRTSLVVSKRLWRGPKGRVRVGRTLPLAVIRYAGQWVCTVGVHNVWNHERNATAEADVRRRLEGVGKRLRMPLLLTGDWNRTAKDPVIRDLARTIGAEVVETGAHVDYELARGLKGQGITLGRLKGGSDHPPIRTTHTKENQ